MCVIGAAGKLPLVDLLIVEQYWRVALATIGLLLILAGLLFLRNERTTLRKDEVEQKEMTAPSNESGDSSFNLPKSGPLTSSLQEIRNITENYLDEVRKALFPNDLDEFLNKPGLPQVARHWEWWEKAIATGQGPRGIPLRFLGKEKAVQLLKLSGQINSSSQAVKGDRQIVALVEMIYGQSEGFPIENPQKQQEYRENHLRDHIKKVINLNTLTCK